MKRIQVLLLILIMISFFLLLLIFFVPYKFITPTSITFFLFVIVFIFFLFNKVLLRSFLVMVLLFLLILIVALVSFYKVNLENSYLESKTYFLFYFFKLDYLWATTKFWFPIALSGIIITLIMVFILWLYETKSILKPFCMEYLFWFHTDGDSLLHNFKSWVLKPFDTIRDSFSVMRHYYYDYYLVKRVTLACSMIILLLFIFLSIVSVLICDLFLKFLFFNFSFKLFLLNLLAKSLLIYFFIVIIVLNLFLVFSSFWFFILTVSFYLDCKFTMDFSSHGGALSKPLQEESIEDKSISFIKINDHFTNSALTCPICNKKINFFSLQHHVN